MLGLPLAQLVDAARAAAGRDPDGAAFHQAQADLLTPIFKSYATDQGFAVAATAIQTYGGAGFLRDHPVEQLCRDAKIFSIYEGTNHIQAQDLIGRKLRGRAPGELLARVRSFVEAQAGDAALAASVAELGRAASSVEPAIAGLLKAGQAGDLALPPLFANRMLEMMAELVVGLLLLEGAAIARAKLATLPADHRDVAFYQGKVHAAVYYALNVVPGVRHKAEVLATADRSALEIPDAAFATV